MKAYRKIKAVLPEINALQQQVEEVLNPLVRIPLLDGVPFTDVAITTDGIQIEHGLGRTPLGFIVTDNNADVRIWRTASDSFTLTLDASGTATISVWVY